MTKRPYVIDQMISAKSIAARVEALAREITTHFQGTDKLVVVGLLRGSFVFIADLVRELDLPVEVDFLEASSYGDAMQSSREVRILKDLRIIRAHEPDLADPHGPLGPQPAIMGAGQAGSGGDCPLPCAVCD